MQLNAGNTNQNNNIANDNNQAVPQEVKSQISIEARKKVNQLYKALNTTQKKALTGQHLIERLDKFGLNARKVTPARFGRDISDESVPLARQSTAYFLQEIIEQADAQGIGVVLNQKGNNIEYIIHNMCCKKGKIDICQLNIPCAIPAVDIVDGKIVYFCTYERYE